MDFNRIAPRLGLTGRLAFAGDALAQAKHYRLAYDQPVGTGYGIGGTIFADKLKELSKGTMLIDQYPGAQLGQEPQVLQLVKAGDIEFCFSASANAATLTPQGRRDVAALSCSATRTISRRPSADPRS
jgi:TRAP-type C4-dicarboxylate transport system substrate-binding protein